MRLFIPLYRILANAFTKFVRVCYNETMNLERAEGIKEMEGLLKQLIEGQKQLFNEVGSIKNEVSSIKNEVSLIKADVGSLKTDVGSLKTDVGSLKTDVSSLKTDVGSLKTDVGSLKTEINIIKDHMVTKDDIAESTRILRALEHASQVNAAEIEGSKLNTATRESIQIIDAKFDVLNDRLFKQEAELRLIKTAK